MNRHLVVLVPALFLIAAAAVAQTANDCGHCAGVVMLADQIPGPVMPVLVADITTIGPNLQEASPDIVRRWTVLLRINVISSGDARVQIDQQTRDQVDWATRRGPFAAFGTIVNTADPALEAYAAQTAAAMARAAGLAPRIVIRVASLDELKAVVAAGGSGSFDAVIVDAPSVAATAQWLAASSSPKDVYAVVDGRSPNPLFDLAAAFADGARVGFLAATNDWTDFTALDNFNGSLAGGVYVDRYAVASQLDASGRAVVNSVVTLTRMADARSVIVPRGDASAPFQLLLPADRYAHPREVDADGVHDIAAGTPSGQNVIGFAPTTRPFAVLAERVLRRRHAL